MALAMVGIGETRVISNFRGKEEMKRHLQDLGFVKGELVKVVGENASGMILLVKGVKIALNRGLASQIIVE
ncbi:FeoA family protein [Mobilisporobacter senegalensis]|nr:ferrous iron transport protein A [Mobilisporobacter senegalensis]